MLLWLTLLLTSDTYIFVLGAHTTCTLLLPLTRWPHKSRGSTTGFDSIPATTILSGTFAARTSTVSGCHVGLRVAALEAIFGKDWQGRESVLKYCKKHVALTIEGDPILPQEMVPHTHKEQRIKDNECVHKQIQSSTGTGAKSKWRHSSRTSPAPSTVGSVWHAASPYSSVTWRTGSHKPMCEEHDGGNDAGNCQSINHHHINGSSRWWWMPCC